MKFYTLHRKNNYGDQHEFVLVMSKISHIEPYFPNKGSWNASGAQQNFRKGYVISMDNGKEIIINDKEFDELISDLEKA